MVKVVSLGWQIGATFGWGLYGYNLALALERDPEITFQILEPQGQYDHKMLEAVFLRNTLQRYQTLAPILEKHLRASDTVHIKGHVLHARGNNADPCAARTSPRIRGDINSGLIFSENTDFSPEALAHLAAFDHLVAGSTWNADILKTRKLRNVMMNIQGVDPSIYHPAPSLNYYQDRFAIFAGGKLEFRKGQDIALEAFRIFHQRHPEALLIACWHNHWAGDKGITDLQYSPHNTGSPKLRNQQLDLAGWIEAHGLPHGSYLTPASMTQLYLARLIRECHVALFPNRCEGGTNLVAMEAMACGIPTILSANTGHLDLIQEGTCLPLTDQKPVMLPECGMDGWGESSVEEILGHLETVYQNRELLKETVGKTGARFMLETHTWTQSIRRLRSLLDI